MKKQLLLALVVIMAIAMAAFIGIQVYWIKNSMELRRANFRRSIDDAVNLALLNLETIEFTKRVTQADTFQFRQPPPDQPMQPLPPDSQLIRINKPVNSETGIRTSSGEEKPSGDTRSQTQGEIQPQSILNNPSPGAIVRKQLMMNHLAGPKPENLKDLEIEKMITAGLIDTLLQQEFLAKGITTPYEFGVYSPDRNKIVLEKTGKYHNELLLKGYSFPLFSGVGMFTRDFLIIYFPQQSKYNLQSLWLMALLSVLLALTIILAFSFSVVTIIRQRKLSDLKNDFINNMTHEFKTPISTISLACQVLSDKEIEQTDEMYSNYISIIGDENQRLGEMSEKILQTAILEKGSLHLRPETIDMHRLIADAIHKIAIQIEIRDGVIQSDLRANSFIVRGDKVHLSNVIYNLLDNANKYSPRKPQITVATADATGGITISVQDKGMGITKANQKRIFEKLYRVPTGDVHNVKGFGLGLSYVKFIVDKHGGHIQVESEPNKGSTFTLFIPYELPEPSRHTKRINNTSADNNS